MAFTAQPLDGSSTPIPMSSAVPDGTNTPLAIEGGPSITTGGNTLVPVSMYIKDGNNVAQGTTTDAANAATVIGQLKQINVNLADTLADGDNLATLVTNTADLLADGDHLATIDSGIASLVTATADLLADGDNLATIATNTGNIPAKGTAAMAASTPVTIATNDTVLSELLTDTDNLAGIKTDLDSLVTNTADLLADGDFLANIPPKGTAVMTGSTPVTIATDDTQVTAIKNSVAAIPAKGTAVMTGSTPLTIATNDTVFAELLLDTDNLATIAGAISSSKAQVQLVDSAGTNVAGVDSSHNALVKVNSALPAGSALIGNVGVNDGTNTQNVLAATSASNATSAQGAALIGGADKEVSFTTSSVQAVASTDVTNYQWVCVHITTQGGSSTVTFQGSNDNSNWTSVVLVDLSNSSNGSATSTTSAAKVFHGPLPTRYFRLNVTGIASGTTAGVIEFYTMPATLHNMTVGATQSGTWTVQPGNTPNTSCWVMKSATLTGTQAANSNANTVIKNAAGTFYNATVTTTGTAGLIIYDNASTNSGTILLSIPANATVGTIYSFPGGMPAANGITSAGVTNCPAVTIAYGPA
jgi:hypothetical protein